VFTSYSSPQHNHKPVSSPVIGRFAPSPTGPLHFGSLIAALGSWLQARRQGGAWFVRMEDLDKPREQPGAADAILRALEHFGLVWDGEVIYQSQRQELYLATLERLRRDGRLYLCRCSRAEIREQGLRLGLPEGVYSGRCRGQHHPFSADGALRLQVEDREVGFTDGVQGVYRQSLQNEVGDFVLRRRDGLIAYQLAVVVDDGAQGVSEVVRGSDLLDSTPRQIFLQQCLGLPTPLYRHLPVALAPNGQKLSKQNLAPPLPLDSDPRQALVRALRFLGQRPPAGIELASRDSLLATAIEHWRPGEIPTRMGIHEV